MGLAALSHCRSPRDGRKCRNRHSCWQEGVCSARCSSCCRSKFIKARPNTRIHALKNKTLLSLSGCEREFGSMFHHQNSKNQPFSVGFFLACAPPCWRGFRAWPRERLPSEPCVFTHADASLFSVFSGGLASVRETTSCNDAGLEVDGCGWQLLRQKRPNIKPPCTKIAKFFRNRVVSHRRHLFKMTVCRFGTNLFERNDDDSKTLDTLGPPDSDDRYGRRSYS